jgi:hypothetical protein
MFILNFLMRRLAQGALIVFLVTLLIFTLLRVVPGDPVRLMAGGMAPEALIEKIAKDMGLRDPILVQFGRYMSGVVRGDLGQSFVRPAKGPSTGGATFGDTTRGERAEGAQPDRRHPADDAAACGGDVAIALVFSGACRDSRRSGARAMAGQAGLLHFLDLHIAAEFLARNRPCLLFRSSSAGCRRSATPGLPIPSCRPSCWRSNWRRS